MTNSKNDLRKIYFMLRCTKDRHPNCIPMRNAAMCHDSVMEAHTTNLEFEGTSYCVAGEALVMKNEVKDFTNKLQNTKSRSSNPTRVSRIKVLVSQG